MARAPHAVSASPPILKRSASVLGAEELDEVSRHVFRRLAAPRPEVHDAVVKSNMSGKRYKFITQATFDFLHCRDGMRLLICHCAFADFVRDALQGSVWARLLLPVAASPRPLSFFMAAKELCEWAKVMSSEEQMRPVSMLSSCGLTVAQLREEYPGSVVVLEESKSEGHLDSSIAVLLAGRSLSAAQFTCSDAIRQSIALLVCRLQNEGEIKTCKLSTVHCGVSIENDLDEYLGTSTYDICLRIALTRNSYIVVELHVKYFVGCNALECVFDEHYEVEVTFKHSAAEAQSVLFSCGDELLLDSAAVCQASYALLGDPDEGVVTLFVLWRLLCAPLMVRPRGTTNVSGFPEVHSIFERVANKLSEDSSSPCVPWSVLDDRCKFDELACSLVELL